MVETDGESRKHSSNNLNDWGAAVGDLNPGLAEVLSARRSVGFEGLDRLNLPRYERTTLPLPAFLDDPASTCGQLGTDEFYFTVQPTREGLPRFSKAGFTCEQVADYAREKVAEADRGAYDITVQQFLENLYGGNIIINPDGRVYTEFRTGKQGPVSKGNAPIEFTAKRSPYTGLFKYSFEDEELRRAVYATVQTIPHTGEGREVQYHPGYYEFVLVRRKDDTPMTPIFIDYREGETFHLPEDIL